MALYRLTIVAVPPHTDHFREADILFTAPNDTRAEQMSRAIRLKFTARETTDEVRRIGEGKTVRE